MLLAVPEPLKEAVIAKPTFIGFPVLCAVLLCTAVLALFSATDAVARVGVTSATSGDPLGKPPNDSGRVLRVGIDLQANELITTNADDRAHLLFIDGTSLTVGPNAQLTIDKFVYDPDTKTGDLAINASKGVLRLVGGKISKTSAITVTTPSGSLGIRGGIVIMIIGPTQTTAIFVFGNSMTVSANGQTVTVTQPGLQVVTDLGGAPGQPTPVGRGALIGLIRLLEGSIARGGQDNGSDKADQLLQSSGFSRANSRLIAARLGIALPDGAASPGGAQSDDAQRVASQMAAGTPGWQQGLQDYLGKGGGDSGAVVDRAQDVFKAYNQDCASGGGAGCNGGTVGAAAQAAAASACAAQVIPVAISDDYVPPRGSVGYDFQPVGVRPANGFRPVVPGDPRLVGGDKYVAEGAKDNLADDSLSDVKRFRAEAPGNGEYRLILMGAAGAGALTNPFGNQIVINGRTVDVTTGSDKKGASIGGKNSGSGARASLGGTADAPMLVIDITITTKELDIQFSGGAVVSGLIVEPANGISALGPNIGNNNTNSEQCSSAESQIQQAANDGNIPPVTNPPTPPGPDTPPPPPVISAN